MNMMKINITLFQKNVLSSIKFIFLQNIEVVKSVLQEIYIYIDIIHISFLQKLIDF